MGARHHAWLVFVLLVEMGFRHVGQAGLKLFFFFKMGFYHVGLAGLELPTPGDPPTLASKVLGLQA